MFFSACRAGSASWSEAAVKSHLEWDFTRTESQYPRLFPNCGLEGTHKDHRVWLRALHRTASRIPLCPRAMSEQFLSSLSLAALTPAVGRLFQFPTVLWVKNLSLIAKLNIPWHNFHAIPLDLLTGPKTEGRSVYPSASPLEEAADY